MSCCNHHHCYNHFFDKERAEQELQDYLENGLKTSSQSILNMLDRLPLEGKRLLDIGGGIGGVTFELFKRQIHHATLVDISSASIEVFNSRTNKSEISKRVKSLCGDFITLQNQVNPADLVILDKVICCYEDYQKLVHASVQKSTFWYVYSIPRNNFKTWVYFFIESIFDRLKGKYFPLYFHSYKEIERMVTTSGFQKSAEKLDGWWRILLFRKDF